MRKFLSLFICLLFFTSAQAQDPFFSQFYAAPMTLNPALTGAFNGKFRVSGIYRDQYRKTLESQFSTYAVSTDLRFTPGKFKSAYKDNIGVGILFLTDRMGEFDYASNQINISTAYHKSLNPQNSAYLSLGVQFGMNQRTINYGGLTFSDQFNGTTGYVLSTTESLPENNVAFSDLAVGLNFSANPTDNISIFAGATMHHALEPSISFYRFDDEEELDPYESFLPRRYSAQLNVRFPITQKFQLMPRAVVDLQGGNMKIDAGLNYRFLLSAYNGTALQFGTYGRLLSDSENGVGFDSAIVMLGIEYDNILLGFSYDAHIGTFANSNRRSAFEISIAYLGDYENELVLCPKF